MTEDTTTDHPLVTFALFAYNQEKYIREAVEGAFSQTYEPLEIILSDDCSSDRTFEILQEMAGAYEGPHEVKVRQSEVNFGTSQHVQCVAEIMSGELMVVAAGDDVSVPERVAVLVDHWIVSERKPSILHSLAETFEDSKLGTLEKLPGGTQSRAIVGMDWFIKHRKIPSYAPTVAYSKELFIDFPPLLGGSIIEDGPLGFRGFLKNGFQQVPSYLVRIRRLPESSGTGYSIHNLTRWNRFVRSRIISNFNSLQDISHAKLGSDQAKLLESYFQKNIAGLASCIFFTNSRLSSLMKLRVLITIIFKYPIRYGIKGKIGFALKFSGLVADDTYQNIRTFFGSASKGK